MTLGNAVSSLQAIEAILYDKDGERKLPFKLRYKLIRIKDALAKEADLYEKERVDLITKMGEEVEENGQKVTKVVGENTKEFYKLLADVLNTEIEVSYNKLTEEDLAPIENLEIEMPEALIGSFMKHIMTSEE